MVGLRVFDIGALVVWLVWFFRLRDDDDDADGGHGGGGSAPEPNSPSGPSGGLRLPLDDSKPWHPPPGSRPRTDQTTLITTGRARSCGPEC